MYSVASGESSWCITEIDCDTQALCYRMMTDAIAAAGGTMGTPTMPPKGVIKARARGRLGELRAMMQAAATPSPKAAADAHRKERQSQRKEWMKDLQAAWTVTQEQERKLDEKQKQIDEDMKKLEQEKKDLGVPKLQARIRQLEDQLKAKAKKQKSREGQIHQRAKFAELDKQSKNSENQPPAAQKRQKVVG